MAGDNKCNITVLQTSNDCVNEKVFKRCLKVATDLARDINHTVIAMVLTALIPCNVEFLGRPTYVEGLEFCSCAFLCPTFFPAVYRPTIPHASRTWFLHSYIPSIPPL